MNTATLAPAGMIKTIFSDSQDGLRGMEKLSASMSVIETSRQIKQASCGMAREMLDSIKPDRDHVLIHLVAMGEHERYGFNRNGDTFDKLSCQTYHHTFVKNACYYREHANTDPEKRIGDVKASCHNDELGRIELGIWAKKASAPDIIESIMAGESRSYSMACKVAYDISSITEKRQPTVYEYDEYCRDRMTQWIPEHEKYAFVYNPHPNFFDISDVSNPADRIAHHLKYEFDKAAGSILDAQGNRAAIPSAKFASLFTREDVTPAMLPFGLNVILVKLAEAEAYVNKVTHLQNELGAVSSKLAFVKDACTKASKGELSDEALTEFRKMKPNEFFETMAKHATVLPFLSFCSYMDGASIATTAAKPEVKAAAMTINTMFAGMVEDPMADMLDTFLFDGPVEDDMASKKEVRSFVEMAEREFGITPQVISQRTMKFAFTGSPDQVKLATETTVSPEVEVKGKILQKAYGLYKIAAISRMQELFSANFVDEPQYLLLSSQNRNY